MRLSFLWDLTFGGSQPEQGFFAGLLDYRVYEAEFGKVSERGQTVVREPYADREPSWSGPGFVRVVEDSTIEFVVDGIAQSMEYDIVIRYEPQLSGQWEDVRVVLERPEDQPIDIDGPCANVQAGPEESQVPSSRSFTLPRGPLTPSLLHTIRNQSRLSFTWTFFSKSYEFFSFRTSSLGSKLCAILFTEFNYLSPFLNNHFQGCFSRIRFIEIIVSPLLKFYFAFCPKNFYHVTCLLLFIELFAGSRRLG